MLIWASAGIVLRLCAQTAGISYTTELQHGMHGRGNWCNLLRLEAKLPAGRSGEFELATIHIYKTRRERIADDWQTFSNIEEENLPCGIALLGYTQRIGRSEFFLGIRNVNEDYFTASGMSLFTNSSCGIFPTLSANYPIANYPLSGLCLDYKISLGRFGIESSLYNGRGYNGWSGRDNPFVVRPLRDGVFSITEINYRSDHGNYFCGFALHTGGSLCSEDRQADVRAPEEAFPKKVTGVWWGYAEQHIWRGDRQTVDLLIQLSGNTSRGSECRGYAGVGAVWFCNGRSGEDRAGLFVSAARFVFGNEIAGELTFRHAFSEWLSVQPTIHIIRNNAGIQQVFVLRFAFVFDKKAGKA